MLSSGEVLQVRGQARESFYFICAEFVLEEEGDGKSYHHAQIRLLHS